MRTVFTLASGRSGTHFLYQLVKRNALNSVARHETYGFNPSMFGRPIFDFAIGQGERTRKLLKRKQHIVERCGAGAYIETSHAFLKSWHDLASEYFPESRFVHLVRDPLKVAKSEAVREEWIKRLRVPFCHYRGGHGGRYFYWSLTGLEPIFRSFEGQSLSRIQWYAIQWIEIENRAMQFLVSTKSHDKCFTLHSPVELNDAIRVEALFDFLGLKRRAGSIVVQGRKNKNWWPTKISDDDRSQFREVIRQMPVEYLRIFREEPYASLPWVNLLHNG